MRFPFDEVRKALTFVRFHRATELARIKAALTADTAKTPTIYELHAAVDKEFTPFSVEHEAAVRIIESEVVFSIPMSLA